MILAVLLILYVAIGLMIVSVLNAFLDEVGEQLFMFTVLLWPLAIVFRHYCTNYVVIYYGRKQNWRVFKEEI